MHKLRHVIQDNRAFTIGYGLFFLVMLGFCLIISRNTGFLWLDQFHYAPLDIFFTWVTRLGDGIFFLLIVFYYVVRKNFRQATQLLLAFLITGLLVQVLKYCISEPRPRTYFEGHHPIHLISGITHSGFSSFPSGHTATIFSLVTLLALYAKQKSAAVLFLLPAALIGYSRIYLSQHFPVDVFAGSVVGVAVSLLVYCRNWTIPVLLKSKTLAPVYEEFAVE